MTAQTSYYHYDGLGSTRCLPPRRGRLRLSSWLALLLICLLALNLAYIVIGSRAFRQRDALKGLQALGADVFYDYDYRPDQITMVVRLSSLFELKTGTAWDHLDAEPRAPRWLRGLLGEDYFRTVVAVSFRRQTTLRIPEETLRDLSKLGGLEALNLGGVTELFDDELALVGRMKSLHRLFIDSEEITDAGVASLAGLINLRYLGLERTRISDDGLAYLRGLKRLEMLDLAGTEVSDAGLKHLEELTDLRLIYLDDTKVTEKGAARLRSLLPHCDVL